MENKEITIDVKKPELIILLVLLSVILVLELQVTFSSPIVFGDEGFHTGMARYIAGKVEYPVWIPFEGYTKLIKTGFKIQPLLELTEGSFYFIFGFNEAIIKFLNPFIAVFLTGLIIFILGKKLYSEKIGFIAALIAITMSSYITYSVLFYADALFMFYLSLFILTFFLSITKESKKYWIISGIFAALAFLAKTPGFVIFPIIGLGFLYQLYKQKKMMSVLKNYIILGLFLFVIIGSFFLRNYAYYHTPTCNLPFFDNKGCSVTFDYKNKNQISNELEQTGTALNALKMGLINYFNFAYGNVWFIILPFIAGIIVVGLRKKENDILIILMMLSFLPIIYLGSGGRAEDTARYTLGLIPLITLISGIYFETMYDFVNKYKKYLALIIFVVILYFTLLNLNEKLNTMKQVKQFSPSFLEACNFIKQNTSEDAMLMTIWVHQASYSCQRNIAGFSNLPDIGDIILSGNLNLTLSRLYAHGITHIFIQKFSMSQTDVAEKYPISFIQFLDNNKDSFVKVYENGPSLQQCLQAGGCDGNILYQINYKNITK